MKAFPHRGEPPSIYFWRSRDGLEVDIVIDRNGRLYPIEVKAIATVTPEHATGLIRWRRLAGQAGDAPAVIVADIESCISVGPGVRAVPWWIV